MASLPATRLSPLQAAAQRLIRMPSLARVSNAMVVLLLVQSLPMFSGPGWLKSAFARAARSTKGVPNWHWTELEGTSLYLGTVPTSDDNLQELHDAFRRVYGGQVRREPMDYRGYSDHRPDLTLLLVCSEKSVARLVRAAPHLHEQHPAPLSAWGCRHTRRIRNPNRTWQCKLCRPPTA